MLLAGGFARCSGSPWLRGKAVAAWASSGHSSGLAGTVGPSHLLGTLCRFLGNVVILSSWSFCNKVSSRIPREGGSVGPGGLCDAVQQALSTLPCSPPAAARAVCPWSGAESPARPAKDTAPSLHSSCCSGAVPSGTPCRIWVCSLQTFISFTSSSPRWANPLCCNSATNALKSLSKLGRRGLRSAQSNLGN